MNDPRTRTTGWGLTVGVGLGWAEEGKGGKIGTTEIESTKIKKGLFHFCGTSKEETICIWLVEVSETVVFPGRCRSQETTE